MATSDDKTHPNVPYEICIMRHGIAIRRGTDGSLDDSKRKLTPEDREKMEKIARGLQRLNLDLDWIVTSPLVRAVETAQIISDSFGSKVPLDLCDALRPGEPAEKVLQFLAKQPDRRRIMLVGHEPDLSMLAARLLGAGRDAGLAFKKGGCCLVLCEQLSLKMPGRLLWWMTPRVLCAIS